MRRNMTSKELSLCNLRILSNGRTEAFTPTEAKKRPPQYKHRLAPRIITDTADELAFECGIVVVSEMNTYDHHFVRLSRFKVQAAGLATMLMMVKNKPALPVVVKMIRVSPKTLDSDNLSGAFKRCRDVLAKWYDVDDADERIEFQPGQAMDGRDKRMNGIRVEIQRVT